MIKVGVIGAGYWGPNLVRNFYQLAEVEMDTVCDIDQAKLDSIKKNYPAIKTTQNFKEMLDDPQITAVAIALPLNLHYQFTKEALLAGKHVLVEKPFTSNSKEAEELIQIAKDQKKVLIVDHIFLYTGAVRKMKELIDKGELGSKIYYFDSERVNLGLIRSDTSVVWDLATHDISIIDYLISQKPVSVSAIGSSHVFGEKEEMAHITIKHQEGCISHIHVSWLSPLKLRKILLGGDKKMVFYDDVEPTEKIKIYDKGIDIDPEKITAHLPLYRSGDIVIPKLDQTEALKKLTEHFIECIKENKKPLTSGEAGLRVVKILEAVEESMEKGGKLININ